MMIFVDGNRSFYRSGQPGLYGRLAQLGERPLDVRKVMSSSLLPSMESPEIYFRRFFLRFMKCFPRPWVLWVKNCFPAGGRGTVFPAGGRDIVSPPEGEETDDVFGKLPDSGKAQR